uniref:Uncharacterized protein n=1 Tax=Lutzomyia longipalpis TaxID=7200 RepID=A0A1B0CR18_LUTLO
MKATEGQDKLMSFAQKRNSKKGKRSSLDSAYSEIGKEIGSDDEAPEGIFRELSTEHLDTVTTEDRLKLMEEQPRPTTSNSRPRTHPSVSILEPNRDDFRHKSRELHRKDRASSHASSRKGKRSSLDSAYSEIGKEIVEMVGENSIKSIVLVNILRNKSQN